MSRRLCLLGLGIATVVGSAMPPAFSQVSVEEGLRRRAAAGEEVRVLVQLDLQATPEGYLPLGSRAAQRQRIGARQVAVLESLAGTGHRLAHRYEIIPFLALVVEADGLAALARAPGVRRIDEDRAVPPAQSGSSIAQLGSLFVEADLAHDAGFDGSGWAVAILDTGVEAGHPYLGGRVVEEACFSAGADCPNNGLVQVGAGAAAPCSFNPIECEHGTHVAGIAAGGNASLTGVAPGADIIAVQVFSNVGGKALSFFSDQVAGLQHVFNLRTSHDIAAVNMSIGGNPTASQMACDAALPAVKGVIDALRSVGIATVISAGNDGDKGAITQPGCISSAVSVGATGGGSVVADFDAVAGFSNSAPFLALLAPGAAIDSSVPGGFGIKSGTSMAAPHVTGAWALLKQQNGASPVATVLATLQASGHPVTDVNAVVTPSLRVAKALLGGAPQVANDRFLTPHSLYGPGAAWATSTAPSTKETGEPSHAGLSGGSSVWFRWDAPPFLPGTQLQATIDTLGSAFDTGLAVYTGTAIDALTQVAANDDYLPGVKQSQVQFVAAPQQRYLIAVDGFAGLEGDLVIRWNARSNDAFAGALPLSGLSGQVTSSNALFSKESGEPDHAGDPGGASLWWSFTAPVSGSFAFDTIGSSIDTLLAVYTGVTVGSLTPVAADQNSGGGGASALVFAANAGTEYRIAVDGSGGATGPVVLNWGVQGLAETLYTIEPRSDQLRIVDPGTGVTASSVSITLPGETVDGGTGLATNPRTGDLYALLSVAGRRTERELVILNPATGEATSIGNTGDRFAAIGFGCDETLYALTGDQTDDPGVAPESLFVLDLQSAAPTLLTPLGNGGEGEMLAFNPIDGLLYHGSGGVGGGAVFETVDPSPPYTVTGIPIASPIADAQVQGLTYWPSQGDLLWRMRESPDYELFRVTTAGSATKLANLDHQAKGLAFLGLGLGCPDRVQVLVQGNGLVSASGIACPGDCEETYGNGSSVMLTASTPVSGWSFLGWGGACVGQANPCTITSGINTLVTATFATGVIFLDGFESGNTTSWSRAQP